MKSGIILLAALALAPALPAQPAAGGTTPISNVRYELSFDSATAARRSVGVAMRFDQPGGAVELSLPAWTPGAYEISNFVRRVSNFTVTMGGAPVPWNKTDHDSWRVSPAASGTVEVRFDFLADTLDNAMAWSTRDFLMVNGTNVFLYPETGGLEFPSRVTVTTRTGWRVVTGLEPDSGAAGRRGGGGFRAASYHELVDAPFFIGRFDLDSTRIEGVWHRLASYPAGQLAGADRQLLWQQIRNFTPAISRVYGETPFRHYSTLLIFERAMGGGSALEHGNSHVGIYNPQFIGSPVLASITAHEIVHAWNVKRLRPADLVPYRYDRPQPTPLLWVSEGITDYYADLALVRGQVIDSTVFLAITNGKIQNVTDRPAVSLHDASLTTWVHPLDGTEYIYYDKGSLAGLLLDIQIRDASDNRRSLDDVMRTLYQRTFLAGRGFTEADFWNAATEAAGGKSFTDFAARYIRGRDPFPWSTVAPRAGMVFQVDTIMIPRLGVNTISDSSRVTITAVTPGSAAAAAGIEPGDVLVRVGEVRVEGDEWGAEFRTRYAGAAGRAIPVVIRRGDSERTLSATVRLEAVIDGSLEFDPGASPKAARIRAGLLRLAP